LKIDLCDPCNKRMGKLEEAVSPILKPALGGQPISITNNDQRSLARWGTLKALAYDAHTSAQPKVAIEDDYSAFYAMTRPAPELHLWLGRYDGHLHELAFFVRDSTYCPTDLPRLPAGTPHAQFLTIRFGRLIMQSVFIGVRGRAAPSLYRHPDGIDAFAVQAWPASVNPINWPPKQSMDDAALAVFANIPESMVSGPLRGKPDDGASPP
jgi:hypothetical protein